MPISEEGAMIKFNSIITRKQHNILKKISIVKSMSEHARLALDDYLTKYFPEVK